MAKLRIPIAFQDGFKIFHQEPGEVIVPVANYPYDKCLLVPLNVMIPEPSQWHAYQQAIEVDLMHRIWQLNVQGASLDKKRMLEEIGF